MLSYYISMLNVSGGSEFSQRDENNNKIVGIN